MTDAPDQKRINAAAKQICEELLAAGRDIAARVAQEGSLTDEEATTANSSAYIKALAAVFADRFDVDTEKLEPQLLTCAANFLRSHPPRKP